MEFAARNDCTSGPVFPETPGIDLVNRFLQFVVGDRDVDLEHAVPIAAGCFEYRVDVGGRLLGLLLDRAELLLACCRIDRELTGDEYETVINSCLRVVAAGFGSVRRVDAFDFHNCFYAGKPLSCVTRFACWKCLASWTAITRYASIKLYVTTDATGELIMMRSRSRCSVAFIFSTIVACCATKSSITDALMSLCAG